MAKDETTQISPDTVKHPPKAVPAFQAADQVLIPGPGPGPGLPVPLALAAVATGTETPP